jgi:hypothetical protein
MDRKLPSNRETCSRRSRLRSENAPGARDWTLESQTSGDISNALARRHRARDERQCVWIENIIVVLVTSFESLRIGGIKHNLCLGL